MMSLQCFVKFFSTVSTDVKRFSFAAGASGRIGLLVIMCLPLSAGLAVWHEAQATCLPLMVSSRLKKFLPSPADKPVEAGLMFFAITAYLLASIWAVSTSAFALKAVTLSRAAKIKDSFFIVVPCIDLLKARLLKHIKCEQ